MAWLSRCLFVCSKKFQQMWFISVDRQIIFTVDWGITRSHVAYFLWPSTSVVCCLAGCSPLRYCLALSALDNTGVPMVSRLVTRSLLQQIIFIIMLRLIITTHFLYFPSPFCVMINKIVFTIISVATKLSPVSSGVMLSACLVSEQLESVFVE